MQGEKWMEIRISRETGSRLAENPIEIVERKGIGHPDTICDVLAETLSRNLSRYYLDHFGLVLHHNVDKGLLFGGCSIPAFGGGEVLEPMEIFLVGRATMRFSDLKVPVQEIAVESSRQWFREKFHALDPEKHLKIHCLLRPGSQDLTELYLRQAKTGMPLANDTSCGVGYAPLSGLEQMVLATERHLNSKETHEQYPAVGQDIKVMGVRRNGRISLTIACAFVGRYLDNMTAYLRYKNLLATEARRCCADLGARQVEVTVNTADDPDRESIYLTVTGTSGEAGDDGEVGRGNRVNGLITPYRPMNMEAAAGKNPVTHVGKIYNLGARQLAARLVAEVEGIDGAFCYLVSQIGKPVHQPLCTDIRLQLAPGAILADLQGRAERITEESLNGLTTLWKQVVAGEMTVC